MALFLFCSLRMLSAAAARAQEPARSSSPIQVAPEIQAPHTKESEPKPKEAKRSVLAAFDKYEVFGMSAAHGK
jgi:hypothetical protein